MDVKERLRFVIPIEGKGNGWLAKWMDGQMDRCKSDIGSLFISYRSEKKWMNGWMDVK